MSKVKRILLYLSSLVIVFVFLAGANLIPSALAQEVYAREVVGFYKIDLLEGWNLISLPLIPPSKAKGTSTAVGTDSIVDTNATWMDNGFENKWVRVTSGVASGNEYLITSNTSITLIVNGNPQNEGMVSGDEYDVRPNLDEVLGNEASPVFIATSDPDTADQIWVLNPASGQYERAFLSNYPGYEGWRKISDWSPSIILCDADMGFWIKHVGFPTELTFTGEVSSQDREVNIYDGWNLLGSAYPVSLALNDGSNTDKTNLSENAQATPDPDTADQVWVLNPDTGQYERAFLSNYPGYEGWRKISDWSPSALKLEPGKGFWYKSTGGNGFLWTYPKPYSTP